MKDRSILGRDRTQESSNIQPGRYKEKPRCKRTLDSGGPSTETIKTKRQLRRSEDEETTAGSILAQYAGRRMR